MENGGSDLKERTKVFAAGEDHFRTLHKEAGELTAIFVASRKTSLANKTRMQ